MSTLAEILNSLNATILTDSYCDNTKVDSVVASDLMSDVLMVEDENFVLITGLTSEQVVRTADIVGASAIILVNGKKPQGGTLKLAQEHEICLATTNFPTYKACVTVGSTLKKEQ